MSYRRLPYKSSVETYSPSLGGTATIPENTAKYYVDDFGIMHINGYLTVTGSGSGATVTFGLPSSYQIDDSRIGSGTNTDADTAVPMKGEAHWLDQNAGVYKDIFFQYNSSTTLKMNQASGVILDNTIANGDGIKYNIEIPVK